jgi:hypothetical protein
MIAGTVINDVADSTLQGVSSPTATNDVVLPRLGNVASAFSGSGDESAVFTHGGGAGSIRASLAKPLMQIIP